jgi:hypothetical protein
MLPRERTQVVKQGTYLDAIQAIAVAVWVSAVDRCFTFGLPVSMFGPVPFSRFSSLVSRVIGPWSVGMIDIS